MSEAVLALDHGIKRIGVALGRDTFVQTLPWMAADDSFFSQLRTIITEEDVHTIVVGLPERAQRTVVESFIEQLQAMFPEVVVIPWDEVLTTQAATAIAVESEKSRKRREMVDSAAAAVILTEYLQRTP